MIADAADAGDQNGYAGKEEAPERLPAQCPEQWREAGIERDRRGRRPRPGGRRARDVGSAQLRRGDRLDAAGADVLEVAAVRPPPPRAADHRARRRPRRGGQKHEPHYGPAAREARDRRARCPFTLRVPKSR